MWSEITGGNPREARAVKKGFARLLDRDGFVADV